MEVSLDLGSGLFLQHRVQQQLQAVLEVGQGGAGGGQLPGVLAEVPPDQLPGEGAGGREGAKSSEAEKEPRSSVAEKEPRVL